MNESQALEVAQGMKSKGLLPTHLNKYRISENNKFIIAYYYFLLGITSENTRTHYKSIIDHFIRFISNVSAKTPLQVTGIDILAWRDDLLRTGGVAGAIAGLSTDRYHAHAISSVENKTSALSALYEFLSSPGLDGSDPIVKSNPVKSIHNRFKIDSYSNSKKIDIEIFKKVLNQIDRTTIKGKRDYAMLVGFYTTGKRNVEWTTLKWGNLNMNRKPITFTYYRKGNKKTTDTIPNKLWQLIDDYMQSRYGEDYKEFIDDDTYIFSNLAGNSQTDGPITERSIRRIVKNLAKSAGIDPSKICIHSLRHLHAESYIRNGANLEEVRSRLAHKNLNTTQIYTQSFEQSQNRLGDELIDELSSDNPLIES